MSVNEISYSPHLTGLAGSLAHTPNLKPRPRSSYLPLCTHTISYISFAQLPSPSSQLHKLKTFKSSYFTWLQTKTQFVTKFNRNLYKLFLTFTAIEIVNVHTSVLIEIYWEFWIKTLQILDYMHSFPYVIDGQDKTVQRGVSYWDVTMRESFLNCRGNLDTNMTMFFYIFYWPTTNVIGVLLDLLPKIGYTGWFFQG